MIVIMEEGATEEQMQAVIDRMVDLQFTVHRSTGMVHTVLGGVGPEESVSPAVLEELPGVQRCLRIIAPYKLASRHFRPSGTIVSAGGHKIGGEKLFVMASSGGPLGSGQIAELVRAGADAVKAPLPMPGERPPSAVLAVVEVTDTSDAGAAAAVGDALYVPGHSMMQKNLLAALGRLRKPVLLERNPASNVEELLASAEAILAGGNYDVVLCEAGIRTFAPGGVTLDMGAFPTIRKLSHLPVIADPCQGEEARSVIAALSRAAIAAGADGLSIRVDSSDLGQFAELMQSIRNVAAAVERRA